MPLHLWYGISHLLIYWVSMDQAWEYSKLPLHSHCMTQGQETSRQSVSVCWMKKQKNDKQDLIQEISSGKPMLFCFPFTQFWLKKSTQMQHTSTTETKNHKKKIIELTSLSSKESKYTHKFFSFSTISFISNITISGNLFSCIYL